MDAIVNMLEREGLLDPAAAAAVDAQVRAGTPMDDALHAAKGVAEDKVLRFLADYFAVPYVDLETDGAKYAPDKALLGRLPARILVDHRLMPLANFNGHGPDELTVVTSKVFDHHGIDELRLATGMEIHPAISTAAEVDRFARKYLGVGADTLQGLAEEDGGISVVEEGGDDNLDLTEAAQDASIIKFVNQVLQEALESRATDVHVEPFEDVLRVRYRVDGVLVEANIPPSVRKYQAAIVSRLKILSHLDIAEKRVPQDGRIPAEGGRAGDRPPRVGHPR